MPFASAISSSQSAVLAEYWTSRRAIPMAQTVTSAAIASRDDAVGDPRNLASSGSCGGIIVPGPRMNRTLSGLLIALSAACSGAQSERGNVTTPQDAAPPVVEDIHSFARPAEARVTHVALDLQADFASRTLAGTATLTVERAA